MNFLAHVHVARSVRHDTGVAMGAVLPDVESLLGRVFDERPNDPVVATGIRIHHATDAAFHGDERFRAGSIALSRALQARGIGRGASRAVGHAGWELLLDGCLVDDGATTEAFTVALRALAELAGASDQPGAARLRAFADRPDREPIWTGYADPQVVAERLQRQVAHRPLLAFPQEQVGTVAEVLADAAPSIATVGPGLIRDVGELVRAATEP
jgi:hypothetical protein